MEVVVLMHLEPSSHLAVDSRDVITAQCPTHSPHGLHLEWGFPMLLFEVIGWVLQAQPILLIGCFLMGSIYLVGVWIIIYYRQVLLPIGIA